MIMRHLYPWFTHVFHSAGRFYYIYYFLYRCQIEFLYLKDFPTYLGRFARVLVEEDRDIQNGRWGCWRALFICWMLSLWIVCDFLTRSSAAWLLILLSDSPPLTTKTSIGEWRKFRREWLERWDLELLLRIAVAVVVVVAVAPFFEYKAFLSESEWFWWLSLADSVLICPLGLQKNIEEYWIKNAPWTSYAFHIDEST